MSDKSYNPDETGFPSNKTEMPAHFLLPIHDYVDHLRDRSKDMALKPAERERAFDLMHFYAYLGRVYEASTVYEALLVIAYAKVSSGTISMWVRDGVFDLEYENNVLEIGYPHLYPGSSKGVTYYQDPEES